MTMLLLNDPRVSAVDCQDNGESMVSLGNANRRIAVDWSRAQISSDSELFCYARQTVADMLACALMAFSHVRRRVNPADRGRA